MHSDIAFGERIDLPMFSIVEMDIKKKRCLSLECVQFFNLS